jgi:hypothetical protein
LVLLFMRTGILTNYHNPPDQSDLSVTSFNALLRSEDNRI